MAFEKQFFLMLYVVKVAWGRTSWELELLRNEMSSLMRGECCVPHFQTPCSLKLRTPAQLGNLYERTFEAC